MLHNLSFWQRLPDHHRHVIGTHAAISIRFADFLKQYERKINKKYREAKTDEDKLDVLMELECARYLLTHCGSRLNLIYEPPIPRGKKPDFSVSLPNETGLYIEVKHVRRKKFEVVAEKTRSELIKFLDAAGDWFCYSINRRPVTSDIYREVDEKALKEEMDALNRWEQHADALVAQLGDLRSKMPDGTSATLLMPADCKSIEITITKRERYPNSCGGFLGSNDILNVLQNEVSTIRTQLEAGLGKMQAGSPNVIWLLATGESFYGLDFEDALELIRADNNPAFDHLVGVIFQVVGREPAYHQLRKSVVPVWLSISKSNGRHHFRTAQDITHGHRP
ncbi:MAG: hypothetical protein KDB23_30000 [Planctomycetales bacterium]|nr:hypothetical protein [Planctomycetales bacterium]